MDEIDRWENIITRPSFDSLTSNPGESQSQEITSIRDAILVEKMFMKYNS